MTNFTPHAGTPCPYPPTDRIDVRYQDGSYGFDLRADFHGAAMWEHTAGNSLNWIVAHRRAGSPFERGEGRAS